MKEIRVKINQTKSWFFEMTNKTDKPLARLIKKKREKTQINKIRNENEEEDTCIPLFFAALLQYLEHGSNLDVHQQMNG